jgi:hypothetical protein
MRLLQIECTANELMAVVVQEDDYDQSSVMDQALSWGETVGLKLEGKIYIAQDVPVPSEFVLPTGCFFFGFCKPSRKREDGD